MILLGPVPCQGCGTPVSWGLRRWREAGQRKGRHTCPGPICGAFMPNARERCARQAGHRRDPLRGDGHRTAYALHNAARQKRSGVAA